MSKSLGQIAFEAFVAGYRENLDHKEWPGMQQVTRDAWQAAAEAVALVIGLDTLTLAKEDVIEAALEMLGAATVKPGKIICPTAFLAPMRKLHKALEVMEKVER
jgi:hypothetical protein